MTMPKNIGNDQIKYANKLTVLDYLWAVNDDCKEIIVVNHMHAFESYSQTGQKYREQNSGYCI